MLYCSSSADSRFRCKETDPKMVRSGIQQSAHTDCRGYLSPCPRVQSQPRTRMGDMQLPRQKDPLSPPTEVPPQPMRLQQAYTQTRLVGPSALMTRRFRRSSRVSPTRAQRGFSNVCQRRSTTASCVNSGFCTRCRVVLHASPGTSAPLP